MGLTGVGLDLDGTLAVPRVDRETLLSQALAAHAAPRVDRDEYVEAHRRNLTGETREPIFADLLAGHETEVSPAAVARTYRRHVTESLVPVEGARPLLSTLRERYRIGLLTNGPSEAQRTKVTHLGWEDCFDTIVISGDLAVGKPDAGAFDALVTSLGTPPEETAYVGDTTREDIVGAADAGLLPIQVTYPGGPPPHPRAAAAVDRETLAADLPALLEAFSR